MRHPHPILAHIKDPAFPVVVSDCECPNRVRDDKGEVGNWFCGHHHTDGRGVEGRLCIPANCPRRFEDRPPMPELATRQEDLEGAQGVVHLLTGIAISQGARVSELRTHLEIMIADMRRLLRGKD